jgi:hypothetical protein
MVRGPPQTESGLDLPDKDAPIFSGWRLSSRFLPFLFLFAPAVTVLWISWHLQGKGQARNWIVLLIVIPLIPLLGAALSPLFWPSLAYSVRGGTRIELFQGISLWPAIVMRILGMFASLYWIFCAWRALETNWDEIRPQVQLKQKIYLDPGELVKGPLYKRLTHIFSYDLYIGNPQNKSSGDPFNLR